MLCCSHEQRVAPPRAGTTSDVGGGSTVVGVLSRCSGAGSDDRAASGGRTVRQVRPEFATSFLVLVQTKASRNVLSFPIVGTAELLGGAALGETC